MLGVIGAGAMGGALAVQLARAGHDVSIFATEFDEPFITAHERGEPHPSLGVPLPGSALIHRRDAWDDELGTADVLVLAVATAGLVPVVRAAAKSASAETIWAVATKGWEEDTLRSAADLVIDEIGDPARVVVIVGPSIASEIATGVPTAVVCASSSRHAARHVGELFDSPYFRCYTSEDVAGVEVGAVLKNVVAIAIGMCEGLRDEFGVPAMTNAKAFVFSRGLIEMSRLSRALGGRAETVLGLAGAGDLFVTALAGRNGKFGTLLGQGMSPEQALEQMNTTVEGYVNARAAVALATKHSLVLPVVDMVAKVLYYGMAPREAIERLVSASVEEEL